MAFKLDGKILPVGVPFTTGGYNYPANWLQNTTLEEKKAIGITEVADDPVYDSRFYHSDGTAKKLTDTNEVDNNGDPLLDPDGNQIVTLGLKSVLIAQEKETANNLLAPYDWYVVRAIEKSVSIPTEVSKFRDGIRTTCAARETAITNAADTAALVTLFGSTEQSDGSWKTNMDEYLDFYG